MKKVTTFHISKLDAAKKQITVAIHLFLRNADPVSIHTLTSAAHGILKDVNHNLGNPVIGFDINMIRKDKQKEIQAKLNEAQNFFKHADKDHDKILEFRPEATSLLLWDACLLYTHITKESIPLISVYNLWFIANHKESIDRMFTSKEVSENAWNAVKDLDPNNKQAFLEYLPVFENELYKQK